MGACTPTAISLSVNVLFPRLLCFALFLPHDTINVLSNLLCFFYLVFECVIIAVKLFAFGG